MNVTAKHVSDVNLCKEFFDYHHFSFSGCQLWFQRTQSFHS